MIKPNVIAPSSILAQTLQRLRDSMSMQRAPQLSETEQKIIEEVKQEVAVHNSKLMRFRGGLQHCDPMEERYENEMYQDIMMGQAAALMRHWNNLYELRWEASAKPRGRLDPDAEQIEVLKHWIERDAVALRDIKSALFPGIGSRFNITLAHRHALVASVATALERLASMHRGAA